jgi:hypothetical protein
MSPKYNLNARVRVYHPHSPLLMPPIELTGPQTVTAPLAAFCMATILFVYARTSIQAAKRNAQRHREADGGQINWANENLRRHKKLESPVTEGTVGELVGTLREGNQRRRKGDDDKADITETDSERKLRERTGKGRA